MFAFPDPPLTLADETVALRLAAERDIPETLIAHQDDPGLTRALGLARPPSGAELGRRAEASAGARAAGRELWLTVLAAGGADECLGQIDVHDVEPEDRRAVVRIWIAPAHRRRGLGSAALALAGRWLTAEVGLRRLEMFADPANSAIRGAALRAGFHAEGVRRGDGSDPSRSEPHLDAEVLAFVAAELGGQ